MSSFSVYTHSFFRATSCIIFSIESILIVKNWGGSEDCRKIDWVDWNTIGMSKESGVAAVEEI